MAFIAPLLGGGLSSGLGLLSGALGAVGSIMSGAAAAQAANTNAAIAEQTAKASQDQAAFQATQVDRQTRLKTAAAVAGSLENGLEDTGSVKSLTDQVQDTGNLDKLVAVYDGSVRATGYQNQAILDRQEASNDMMGGFLGAATKMLGGFSRGYA